MIYSTRKELSDAVKGQVEQLYSCKAWIIYPS